MNKIEQKVYNKYKKHISKIIKSKYKRKAYTEAKLKKIYFKAGIDVRKEITKIANKLYTTYTPLIDEEINTKLNEFVNSEKFKQTTKAEFELSKKKLSCKALKKYQEFAINIPNDFLDNMFDELNGEISKEEIKYILLSMLYTIIDYIKKDYVVKISTVCKIFLTKRDLRINLPDVHNRILENRIIPKLELCSVFDYKLFQEINKNNEAIQNYYKAKADRFLALLRRKKK